MTIIESLIEEYNKELKKGNVSGILIKTLKSLNFNEVYNKLDENKLKYEDCKLFLGDIPLAVDLFRDLYEKYWKISNINGITYIRNGWYKKQNNSLTYFLKYCGNDKYLIQTKVYKTKFLFEDNFNFIQLGKLVEQLQERVKREFISSKVIKIGNINYIELLNTSGELIYIDQNNKATIFIDTGTSIVIKSVV